MKRAFYSALFGLALTSNIQALTLTFDDITGDQIAIPNGYGGLNWNNFFVGTSPGPSGYVPVSGTKTAYNAYGTNAVVSGGVFTLNSAYMSAAWNDDLQVTVTGKLGGATLYENTFTLSATTPTLINFDYFGIDAVVFHSFGGTPHAGYFYSGTQFSMDNMVINVPEPGCLTLFGMGLVASIFRRRSSLKSRTISLANPAMIVGC